MVATQCVMRQPINGKLMKMYAGVQSLSIVQRVVVHKALQPVAKMQNWMFV